jgi:hypothetical protein
MFHFVYVGHPESKDTNKKRKYLLRKMSEVTLAT